MERPFSSVPGRAACALRDDVVVSKNTNELRTGVPWAFRMRGIYAWLAMGAVLPPLSVGKMTLRLYGALNYSHDLSKGPSFGTGRATDAISASTSRPKA